jgi:hypothetical protein
VRTRVFRGVIAALSCFLAFTFLPGCNSGSSPASAPPPPPSISVNVSPGTSALSGGATQAFTATVTNDSSNAGVTWSIGSGAGTLTGATASGVTYGAPASIDADSTVTITATSVSDTSKSASASITLNAPPPTITGVTAACALTSVQVGQTSQCTATVTGTGSFSSVVNWSVAGVAGGNASAGTISTSGLYTAPATLPTPNPVTITASSSADASKSGDTSITIGPALASIVVTPPFPSVTAGVQQQFKATGTYTDSSTQDLTSLATWTSSNTASATITSAGLASAVAGGTSTMKAALGSVSGTTSLIVTAPTGTVSTASAVTDSNGLATVISNGLTVPVQLTDQDTGTALAGAAVALGTDPAYPGSAILLIADSTGVHPLQMILLEGPATASSTAGRFSATPHSSLSMAEPAQTSSPVPIAASTGCGAGSGTVASQAITLNNLPVPPVPVSMAGAQSEFLDALNALETQGPSAVPADMYGPISVTQYSPTVASDCVHDVETVLASHINAKNGLIFVLEQVPQFKLLGKIADVVAFWNTRGEVISAFKSCYYQTGEPQTIDITQVCFGPSCVFIPQIQPVPNPGPGLVVAAGVTPMTQSLMTFKSESDIGLMVLGTTDNTGTGEVGVPAGANTVCVDSPGYAQYIQPGFNVAAPGTPLDVTLTPEGQAQTYSGTYSAPFSGTASDPDGGVYSVSADFTFNFILTDNVDGSITGTASVPTNLNISVVSCPSADTCSANSFSATAIGNVSGSNGAFSANLSSGGTYPLTINLTGTLAGTTGILNGTFSETFEGTSTDAPPTFSPLSGTISGATLNRQ